MGTDAKWSYKTGEKGRNRVRAYEKTGSGIIYLEFYERDPETGERKRKRVSTGHRDREKAKQQADKLAAEFAVQPPEPDAGTTLRELFDKYLKRRSPHVSERRQRFHRRATELFCRYYGPDREAVSLDRSDWDQFAQDRASGRVDQRGHEVAAADRKERGANTVRRDLQGLRAALNWGVQADLLGVNPTEGYPLPSEDSPRRPSLSEGRYRAMLAVAGDVDWRFEVALVLANETGHRIRAIRHLRWSDLDLGERLVRWRGGTDKAGHEHVTPLTELAVDELRKAQAERAGIGEAWVLPAPEDASEPVSRHLLRDWWYRAEDLAELEHVKRLGWHGLRRKFADEHREVPAKDLADLGGWKTPRTISEVYQGADLEAMRRAQERRKTLREGSGTGG